MDHHYYYHDLWSFTTINFILNIAIIKIMPSISINTTTIITITYKIALIVIRINVAPPTTIGTINIIITITILSIIIIIIAVSIISMFITTIITTIITSIIGMIITKIFIIKTTLVSIAIIIIFFIPSFVKNITTVILKLSLLSSASILCSILLLIKLMLVIFRFVLIKCNFWFLNCDRLCSFIASLLLYANRLFKMLFRLTELSRTAFPDIFFTACLSLIVLLPKQTILKQKKSAKQRKYKNC